VLRLSLPALGANARVEYLVDDDVAVVFGRVSDYTGEFPARQMEHVSRAVAKRRSEFSTGRFFARSAQRLLGRAPVYIEPSSSRRPVWPIGMVGSICHTESFAMVVLSTNGQFAGLGVDMELADRVTESTMKMVLTPAEIRALPDLRHVRSPAAVIFSGKEAVYKAVNPLVGLMIEFEEVELDFNVHQPGGFTARYIGPNNENRLIDRGRGSFEYYEGHVVTTFVIPEPPAGGCEAESNPPSPAGLGDGGSPASDRGWAASEPRE